MSVNELYKELCKALDKGETAFILSEYNKDGSIGRELVCEDERAQKTSLTALQQSPHAEQKGPLTLLKQQEDDSFVLIERYMPKPRLIILGGGHIGLVLADLAFLTGFDTIIYDERPSFSNPERFRTAQTVICDAYTNIGEHLTFGPSDFVVDVTSGHHNDIDCMSAILSGPEPAYTGMIGSERRVAIVLNELENRGFDTQRLKRIHAPIGLKIGGQTPAEVAISIMAQIIQVKRLQLGEKQWLSGDLKLIDDVDEKGFTPEALITVLSTSGSVPTEVGCKLGITSQGNSSGTVGGGAGEAEAMQIGRELIHKGGWKIITIDLTDTAEDEGMVCGGTLELLIEKV